MRGKDAKGWGVKMGLAVHSKCFAERSKKYQHQSPFRRDNNLSWDPFKALRS